MMAFRQFEGGGSNEMHDLRKVLEWEEEEEECFHQPVLSP